MIWSALLKTVALCVISIIIEAISATKEGRQWFDNLKRPKFSFPLKVWYLVGAVYYILFGIVAYRQFVSGMSFFSTCIILLTMMMLINGLSNFLLFKYRSTKWFYLIIYPFSILLLALIIIFWRDNDKVSAILASLYFLWLFYDLYWAHNLWKLNSEFKPFQK